MWLKNERCGKYELLEKLASGGMADIFLGRSVSAEGVCQFVAVKRIQPRFSDNPQFQSMFREEARVAIALKNKNIVSTLDFGFENEQYYLVMDFIEGVTLRQLSNEMKKVNSVFSIEHAIFLIKEVAAGLNFAHHAIEEKTKQPLNLIHRDLSPHNVMVSYAGNVKIIDFGIAQIDASNQNTSTQSMRGKCRYMSPEQAECEEIDGRSDIFSLGIILWEMLANDQLFNDKSEIKILQKVKACEIPPIRLVNANVSTELALIVNRALAKDPAERYQAADHLAQDLSQLLKKNYPNFSSPSLGSFTKKIFQSHSTELTEKLMKIAVLPYESSKNLVVLDSGDHTQVHGKPPAVPKDIDQPIELPDGLGNIAPNKKKPIENYNFSELLEKNVVAEPIKNLQLEKNTYAHAAQVSFTQTGKTHRSEQPPSADIRNSFVDGIFKLGTVGLIVALVYLGFTKVISPSIRSHLVTVGITDAKKGYIQESSLATEPVKAANTPAEESDLYAISKNMKLGFLNISLATENPKIQILINGKVVFEKLPLYMYPVAAGKEVTITAYDPDTKISVQQKVIVISGKTIDVPLSLKSEKK